MVYDCIGGRIDITFTPGTDRALCCDSAHWSCSLTASWAQRRSFHSVHYSTSQAAVDQHHICLSSPLEDAVKNTNEKMLKDVSTKFLLRWISVTRRKQCEWRAGFNETTVIYNILLLINVHYAKRKKTLSYVTLNQVPFRLVSLNSV